MKIKIIHILHSVGGVDVSVRLILENIDPEKFYSVVVHGKKDTQQPFLDKNGNSIKSFRTDIERNISLIKDSKGTAQIKKIIEAEKPNLIHAHSAKGGIIGKFIGKQLEIPVLHTPQAYSFLSTQNPMKRKLFLMVERYFSKFNNKILASSSSERIRAIEEVGYKPENTLLFNNSIKPIEKIEPLSIKKTWPDEYICSVGRPSFQKNIELMIRVLAVLKKENPNIHLVLMGVGFHSPNLEAVKKQIRENQLEKNITLLEWTRREDVFHIIKQSKLYISTARYEGLPYSVIEALALKKACVVTDVDGNRDLVENGQNGFVIFDENVETFKNKILQLLDDEEMRTKFENNSFDKFQANFNIEKTIDLLENIYLKTINKK